MWEIYFFTVGFCFIGWIAACPFVNEQRDPQCKLCSDALHSTFGVGACLFVLHFILLAQLIYVVFQICKKYGSWEAFNEKGMVRHHTKTRTLTNLLFLGTVMVVAYLYYMSSNNNHTPECNNHGTLPFFDGMYGILLVCLFTFAIMLLPMMIALCQKSVIEGFIAQAEFTAMIQ